MVGYIDSQYQPRSMMASDCDETTPTEILNLAIRKRRELYDQKKEPDLIREILNKTLIKHLCQQLGQGRYKKSRRHRSRSSSKRRRSTSNMEEQHTSKKIRLDEDSDPEKLYIVEDQLNKGEIPSNLNDFEIDTSASPSMVQSDTSSVSIDYEQMERYLDSNETAQFGGYVGHWSENASVVPNLSQDQLDDPKVIPNISQTLLQDSNFPPNDKVDSAFLDPTDPLEMNEFFSQIYDYSMSIEPTKEFTSSQPIELALCAC